MRLLTEGSSGFFLGHSSREDEPLGLLATRSRSERLPYVLLETKWTGCATTAALGLGPTASAAPQPVSYP
jgi:hypothetical protein